MNLNIQGFGGADASGSVELNEAIFGENFNETLIHQVVTAYFSNARSGTRRQKNRSDVRGGGAKPWRQKGTGRARSGTSRSPLWRSGGVSFAARPQDHSQKVNRKMYRKAMRSILAELARQERLVVVEAMELAEPKTKLLKEQLDGMGIGNALLVLDSENRNIELAARNIPHVDTIAAGSIDPVSLIAFDKVLITSEALKAVEGALS